MPLKKSTLHRGRAQSAESKKERVKAIEHPEEETEKSKKRSAAN